MEEQTISFLLYINLINDHFDWLGWYSFSKEIIRKIGYSCNYIAVESQHFHSGKVLQLRRNEKRLLNEINGGSRIDNIQLMFLPPNFNTAVFDYEAQIIKYNDFIMLTVNKHDFNKVDINMFITEMEKYIHVTYYEIFEMSRYETPFLYATKDNPKSFFKTLKILSTS